MEAFSRFLIVYCSPLKSIFTKIHENFKCIEQLQPISTWFLAEKLYLCKFEQKEKEILGIYFIYGQEIQRVQEVRSFKVS